MDFGSSTTCIRPGSRTRSFSYSLIFTPPVERRRWPVLKGPEGSGGQREGSAAHSCLRHAVVEKDREQLTVTVGVNNIFW